MPKLQTTVYYEKRVKRFLTDHPFIITQYKKTINILGINPFHPSLRFHKLKGVLREYQSVSISLKYRIVIDFIIKNDVIILIDIGDHGEVY